MWWRGKETGGSSSSCFPCLPCIVELPRTRLCFDFTWSEIQAQRRMTCLKTNSSKPRLLSISKLCILPRRLYEADGSDTPESLRYCYKRIYVSANPVAAWASAVSFLGIISYSHLKTRPPTMRNSDPYPFPSNGSKTTKTLSGIFLQQRNTHNPTQKNNTLPFAKPPTNR